jgi:DNA-binding transcriptional ArsR family regulator
VTEELIPLRLVEDVETLRVLTDPLRLSILRVVMKDAHVNPRLLSVKEIAEELGEPQTKLYRHIKQLEQVGVIRDAQTRLVSGIVEHRYAPAQRELRIEGAVLGDMAGDDAGASVAGVIDSFRDHFVGLIRTGGVRLWPNTDDPEDDYTRARLGSMHTKLAPEVAADLYRRLSEVLTAFEQAERDETGVDVHLFATWFVPKT